MGVWTPFQSSLEFRAQQQLRKMLALFPDRTTYEQWLDARQVDDAKRAHMERFLPDALKAQGTV